MNASTRRPAICYETGLDESFLVGTRTELIAFAHAVIAATTKPGEPLEYLGIKTLSIPCALTETMADVTLDGIIVVENEHDRRDLINRIRTNNGEMPFDWESAAKSNDESQSGPRD